MENQKSIEAQLNLLKLEYEMKESKNQETISTLNIRRDYQITEAKKEMSEKRMQLITKRYELDDRQHEFYMQGEQEKSDKLKLQRNEIDKQLALLKDELHLTICRIEQGYIHERFEIENRSRIRRNEYQEKRYELRKQLAEVLQNQPEVEL